MKTVYLVTGFPGFIGSRLVPKLLERDPEATLHAVVLEHRLPLAEEELASWPESVRARVHLLTGDVVDMHMGLSSAEYRTLTSTVTDVFHLAAIYHSSVDEKTMRAVNVDGTRNVLEFAADCRHLARFNHMSTSVVSGTRVGVITEDELDERQRFRNPYERTKFEAEKLVHRARSMLPVTIFRPGIVVGDSRTGEVDRFDGPYYLAILLVSSPAAVPLPLPGSAVAPLNVVPVDFVIDAMVRISHDQRAIGRTFHLVDPNPLAARKVYELIARSRGKKMPALNLSWKLADKLLQFPLLERLVREERTAITSVNQLTIFNSANTLELLDGTGIRCPRLPTYLDKLIDYVQDYYERKRDGDDAPVEDSLG